MGTLDLTKLEDYIVIPLAGGDVKNVKDLRDANGGAKAETSAHGHPPKASRAPEASGIPPTVLRPYPPAV